MNKSALSEAISKINKGESPLLNPDLPLQEPHSELDDVFTSNPSRWEELDELYKQLGSNLINLASSISEMVHREEIILNLGNDRTAFLDLARRSLMDCEHVSTQLATTKELHAGKVGLVSTAEEYTEYLRIYTYYESIMVNNLSMINLSAIDLINIAQTAAEKVNMQNIASGLTEVSTPESDIEDAEIVQPENETLGVAIEVTDSEVLTLEAEEAINERATNE